MCLSGFFGFGDVFDPDDPLSVWICTLGISFNDVIYSNVKVEAATKVWERFYGWRVAIGHFNEAVLHLEADEESLKSCSSSSPRER